MRHPLSHDVAAQRRRVRELEARAASLTRAEWAEHRYLVERERKRADLTRHLLPRQIERARRRLDHLLATAAREGVEV